jgi:hypothetical protein
LCMASPPLEVCDLTTIHILIWQWEKQIWMNWRMQFHVMGIFKWSFKLIFFAFVCHQHCTNINVPDNVICKRMRLASPHLDVWFDDEKNKFEWIQECNFMWWESSIEISNWFFNLYMPSMLQYINVLNNMICKRMCLTSPHLDVWKHVDLFIVLRVITNDW